MALRSTMGLPKAETIMFHSPLQQSKTKSDDMHRLIVSSGKTFRFFKCGTNKEIEWTKLEYPLKSPKQDIAGCCNGLLLLVERGPGEECLILWNPSTRESQKIPFPSFLSNHVVLGDFGFGYDQSTDDLKVIILEYNDFVHII
ncbi:hypothetical protein CCACVL1_24894 [Corchorus capsularis]|uniref:F-box protein n=1 Tax=Corchorus capsularis TaxID=210143 RepID=A0A1R3GMU3_COCAP|nr:hypothetical protein CCACVL1_24894 [Corchorus capsularis]